MVVVVVVEGMTHAAAGGRYGLTLTLTQLPGLRVKG